MTIPDYCAYHLPGEIDEFCSPFCSYELVLSIGAEQHSNPALAQELQRLLGRSSSNTPSNIGSFRSAGGDSSRRPSETLLIEFLASFESSSDFSRLVSISNDYGQTLAHLAVPFRCNALLGALIKWGSDISVPDANGFTPLDFAYLYEAQECIDILLTAGASTALVDTAGQTPRELGMIDSRIDHGDEAMALDRKEDDASFRCPSSHGSAQNAFHSDDTKGKTISSSPEVNTLKAIPPSTAPTPRFPSDLDMHIPSTQRAYGGSMDPANIAQPPDVTPRRSLANLPGPMHPPANPREFNAVVLGGSLFLSLAEYLS